MNLRKISHQSYLIAKKLPNGLQNNNKQEKVNNKNNNCQQIKMGEDEQKIKLMQTSHNQETNEITVSDFEVSTHQDKQLISNQKSNKRHFSPIFRSSNITIETNVTKKRLSLSKDIAFQSNFSSLWDSNHSGKKQSIKYQLSNEEQKQQIISKGSLNKLEKGVKRQQELDEFIKVKNQSSQTHSMIEKIKKLEKYKIKPKIKIEYEIDEKIDKQNNDRECQVDLLSSVKQQIQQQLDIPSQKLNKSKSIDSAKPTPLIPIHIRYQYEQEYKQAKQNQQREQFDLKPQKKAVTQDKIEEFIKEQERYLQKKAEFFSKEYEKKLWQIQQNESECQFKPTLNEESCRILDKKQKGKKFQERQDQFQQCKMKKIEEQAQYTLPTFTPTISKKTKKVTYFFKKILENAKPRLSSRTTTIDINQNYRTKTLDDQ